MSDISRPALRILLVDDNQDGVDTLAYLLREAGAEVVVCYDGTSALTALKTFDPNVCVIDINMPRITGYDLARSIRARGQPGPVLATLTAYDDYTHLDRAVDCGFELHFTKPVEASELIEQLEHAVRTKATRDRRQDDTIQIFMPEGGSGSSKC